MHRTVFVCLLAAAYSEECHSDESDLIQKQVRTKALDWRWDLPKAREVPLDLLQAGRSGESLTTTPAPGPNPAGPPALCHGHDCDYWAVSGYSCEMLHDYYQCDCSGSKCTLDLPTCQKTCNGHSCDYWAGLYNMQCHAEPLDQCDCSGCLCMNDVKVNTSAVPPSPTPNASTTGSPSTGEVCEICGTEPCDYWVQNGIFNCDQLAGYECTCKGCSVCQASNSSNSSNSSNGTVHHDDSGSSCALCGIKTCDDWVHNEEYSCDQLLNEYRCSCQGCSVCQAPPTVGSHSPVANVTSNATQDECESCAGQTCEYWVNAGHYDCAYLKNYGCTCRGCSVCKENYHGGTTAAPTEEETTEPETDEDETSEPETDEGGTTGAPTEEETTEPEMDEDETSEPETDEGGTTAAPTEEETTEPETDEGGTTAAPTEGGSTAAPTEATTSVEANTTEVCEMCGSKSCDDWIRTGLYDCHYLQDISACGCKGCGLCKAKNGTTPAPTGPTPRPTEATTTPKGSPTTGPQECEKCGAESCDFWIHQKLYDCAYLKNYGCSCAGCQECQDTTGSEAPQPTTAPQVTRKPDEECEQCNGASCDYWVTQGVADCAELHSLGCTCSGCSSCQATTAPQQPETDVTTTKQEACPQCTSLGMTCDEAAEQHGYSCKYVTAAGWGCDCSTCNCPLDKEVCPKNCGGDHDCDFWMAQKQGWTCDELESTYGCVCNGCSSCASA